MSLVVHSRKSIDKLALEDEENTKLTLYTLGSIVDLEDKVCLKHSTFLEVPDALITKMKMLDEEEEAEVDETEEDDDGSPFEEIELKDRDKIVEMKKKINFRTKLLREMATRIKEIADKTCSVHGKNKDEAKNVMCDHMYS